MATEISFRVCSEPMGQWSFVVKVWPNEINGLCRWEAVGSEELVASGDEGDPYSAVSAAFEAVTILSRLDDLIPFVMSAVMEARGKVEDKVG